MRPGPTTQTHTHTPSECVRMQRKKAVESLRVDVYVPTGVGVGERV